MRSVLFPLLSGVLFAAGLALGGMTDPAKVRAFLDITGAWDPSLAAVMGGAIGVYAPLRWLLRRKQAAFRAAVSQEQGAQPIQATVLLGAAVFGVGWGLSGFCPGPALVSAGTGQAGSLLFVAAMVTGILVFRVAERVWWARHNASDGINAPTTAV